MCSRTPARTRIPIVKKLKYKGRKVNKRFSLTGAKSKRWIERYSGEIETDKSARRKRCRHGSLGIGTIIPI